jgi:hypothetical protein
MEDCEIEDSEKTIKKALKKLNEIEKLKKKSLLTEEENEKISREQYYRKIAFPEMFKQKPSAKEEEFSSRKKTKKHYKH